VGGDWPGGKKVTECGSMVPVQLHSSGLPDGHADHAGMKASTATVGSCGSFTPTWTVTFVGAAAAVVVVDEVSAGPAAASARVTTNTVTSARE